MRRILGVVVLLVATLLTAAPATAVLADHTVTFVNRSGRTVWVGSGVNADGSVNFANLPVLQDGQSATVTIPESSAPNHWRGKFFARQDCTGTPGSTFRCRVGDCGPFPERCAHGEQPASLAEFNFDQRDPLAPWYNVSYVNAFSLPVTIEPRDASAPPPECEAMGCTQNLLPFCPPDNLTRWPDGTPMLCVNPNRGRADPVQRRVVVPLPPGVRLVEAGHRDGQPGGAPVPPVQRLHRHLPQWTVAGNAGW